MPAVINASSVSNRSGGLPWAPRTEQATHSAFYLVISPCCGLADLIFDIGVVHVASVFIVHPCLAVVMRGIEVNRLICGYENAVSNVHDRHLIKVS